jgi:hypothetical protein
MKMRLLTASALLLSLVLIVFAQADIRQLTASELILVDGSKGVILLTGISEPYFNKHFKLLKVIDKPSDRRVVWQFSVNGYQAVLNDAIGYSTDLFARRVYTHSIALGETTEIQRTISRARALRLMRSCIGDFENPAVEYGPVNGRAELLLVANARNRVESKSARERQREERAKRKATAAGTDVIESEEDEGGIKPLLLGAINLQTGKCTKGAGTIAP